MEKFPNAACLCIGQLLQGWLTAQAAGQDQIGASMMAGDMVPEVGINLDIGKMRIFFSWPLYAAESLSKIPPPQKKKKKKVAANTK